MSKLFVSSSSCDWHGLESSALWIDSQIREHLQFPIVLFSSIFSCLSTRTSPPSIPLFILPNWKLIVENKGYFLFTGQLNSCFFVNLRSFSVCAQKKYLGFWVFSIQEYMDMFWKRTKPPRTSDLFCLLSVLMIWFS